MKKVLIFLFVALFLVSIGGFVLANGEGNQTTNQTDDDEKICCESYGWGANMVKCCESYEWTTREECVRPEGFVGGGRTIVNNSYCILEGDEEVEENETEIEDKDKDEIEVEIEEEFENESGKHRRQIKLHVKNRLRINQSELPENCTVTGVVLKCNVDGVRTMAVFAGKSGNTILQVKGINATTKSQLYKENDSFYAVSEDNETVLINYFPDEIVEKIRNRVNADVEYEEEIELDEEGVYRVKTKKKARLFYLFPVREKVKAQVNPETGEIIKIRNPWWGFLAKDIEE